MYIYILLYFIVPTIKENKKYYVNIVVKSLLEKHMEGILEDIKIKINH